MMPRSICLLPLFAACCWGAWPAHAVAGDPVDILGPGTTYGDVETRADLIKDDAAALWFSSAGYPGQTNFDERTVSFLFQTVDNGVQLVAFSDDGVSVTVTDLDTGEVSTPLNLYNNGQALPNLAQSLKLIPQSFVPGHSYRVETHYLNTLYTGDGDIDGLKFFAFGGVAVALAEKEIELKKAPSDFHVDYDPPEETEPVLRLEAGQQIKITLTIQDVDRKFITGQEDEALFPTTSIGGKFRVKLSFTNAAETGTNKEQVTIDTVMKQDGRQYTFPRPVVITVKEGQNVGDKVDVNVTIEDLSTYVLQPGERFKPGTNAESWRDDTVKRTFHWTVADSKGFPIDQRPQGQMHVPFGGGQPIPSALGSKQRTEEIFITYLCLDKLIPAYLGCVINEEWSKLSSDDITFDRIDERKKTDAFILGGAVTVSDVIDYHINVGGIISESSFVVDNRNQFYDFYCANAAANKVNAILKDNAPFVIKSTQTYKTISKPQLGKKNLLSVEFEKKGEIYEQVAQQ